MHTQQEVTNRETLEKENSITSRIRPYARVECPSKRHSRFVSGSNYISRLSSVKQESKYQIETKRRNIEAVLLYSSVTPFIWHRGMHWCFFCQVSDKNPNEILAHYACHDCVNIPVAVKRYTQKRGNREAAIKVEITGLYCKLCAENMPDLKELIHHLILKHDVEYDLSIPNCFLPFRLTDAPTCGTCDIEFDLFEFLLRHANKEHLDHFFICEICGKSSYSERYHVLHTKAFHREGGYACEYCDQRFSSLPKKSLHVQNKHVVKIFECDFCDESLKSAYLRNVHLAEVHGLEEKRIKCPQCPKVFPQDNIMVRHLKRVHLKQKKHECPICNEPFFERHQMKIHYMGHIGDKNYSCEKCGKAFGRKAYLNRHLLSHNQEQEHINMISQKRHIGDNNYSCEKCGRAFGRKAYLNRHLLSHNQKQEHINMISQTKQEIE